MKQMDQFSFVIYYVTSFGIPFIAFLIAAYYGLRELLSLSSERLPKEPANPPKTRPVQVASQTPVRPSPSQSSTRSDETSLQLNRVIPRQEKANARPGVPEDEVPARRKETFLQMQERFLSPISPSEIRAIEIAENKRLADLTKEDRAALSDLDRRYSDAAAEAEGRYLGWIDGWRMRPCPPAPICRGFWMGKEPRHPGITRFRNHGEWAEIASQLRQKEPSAIADFSNRVGRLAFYVRVERNKHPDLYRRLLELRRQETARIAEERGYKLPHILEGETFLLDEKEVEVVLCGRGSLHIKVPHNGSWFSIDYDGTPIHDGAPDRTEQRMQRGRNLARDVVRMTSAASDKPGPIAIATTPGVTTSPGWNLFRPDEDFMEGPAPKDLELFGTRIVRRGEVVTIQEICRRIAAIDEQPRARQPGPPLSKITPADLRSLERPPSPRAMAVIAETPRKLIHPHEMTATNPPPASPTTAIPAGSTRQANPVAARTPVSPGAEQVVRDAVEAAHTALRARQIELEVKETDGRPPRPYATGTVDITEGSRFLWVRGLAETQTLLFILNLGFGEDSGKARLELDQMNEKASGDEYLLHAAFEDGYLAIRALIHLDQPWDEGTILKVYDQMVDLCAEVANRFGPAPEDSPAVVNYHPKKNGIEGSGSKSLVDALSQYRKKVS